MDGVIGVGVRELPVRGLVGVLAVLLGIVLVADQTFWGMMDGFLDKLLVPVVETQADAFSKVPPRASCYREDTEIEREVSMLLEAAAIPKESGLLLKDAVPVPLSTEGVSPEILSDGEDVVSMPPVIPNIFQPQAEGAEHLNAEAKLPEMLMPTPEDPSVVVPEYLPDVSVIVEDIVENVSESDMIVSENPTDISTPMEVEPENPVIEDIKKPSGMVSEQQPDTLLPAEVITPAPADPEVIVPEDPAEEPVIPEPAVPGTEITKPGVIEDVPADVVEEENGESKPASCFLLDEAGMLYGFLPEYADIADGCLTLPAECTGIRSGVFMGCGAGIVELYIPAGTVTIEEGALSGMDSLEWIEVESGNPGYTSDQGVLLDSTMSVLVKFPSGRVSAYSIPPYVAAVANGAFEGTSLSKLDIRNCADLSFSANAFGYSAGNGIEIAVPEAQFDMYTQMLSGYGFILTK